MRNSVFETVLGAVVLLGAGAFLFFALGTSEQKNGSGYYQVTANFNQIVGVEPGTDVMLAGVKVGRVLKTGLDAKTYEAEVTLAVSEGIELPDDSDAKISANGLLGGSFVSIEPGGSMDMIPTDGSGVISYTRGSVDLLTLLGSAVSGLSGGGTSDGNDGSTGDSQE